MGPLMSPGMVYEPSKLKTNSWNKVGFFKMRQFEKKNPPTFENILKYLKLPTVLATVTNSNYLQERVLKSILLYSHI